MPAEVEVAVDSGPSWHSWLAAVVPAQARRFRVTDPEVAAILGAGSAQLVDEGAQVEIGAIDAIRGDAPVAIVRFGPWFEESEALLRRVGHRLGAYARSRSRSLHARRALGRQGFSCALVVWDLEQRLRFVGRGGRTWLPPPQQLRMSERLPGAAVVVGTRSVTGPTVFEDALAAAATAEGEARLDLGTPTARASGLLIGLSDRRVFKVAIGRSREELDRHCAGLALVASARLGAVVRDRVPRLRCRGEAGLGCWSLEDRLDGHEPATLNDRVMADCLDLLVELHSSTSKHLPRPSLQTKARLVADLLDPHSAQALMALSGNLERELADVPRGLAHGDFSKSNILVEGGRLRGVVDWAGAAAGQLPMLDVLNLLVGEREPRHFGRALTSYLLPWARAGGDDLSRAYCDRLGLQLGAPQLRGLAIAWWLERAARELQTYGDRVRRPVWIQQNLEAVLAVLLGRATSGWRSDK